MNILVLANKVPYPPNDGGAFATLSMCTGLSNAGANITLLAMTTPKHRTLAKDIPDCVTEKFTVETVYVDTKISPFKALLNFLFSSKPYNAVRFESKEFANLLSNLLQSNTYDLVQLEGLYLTPYIKIIRSKISSPIALRAHNVEHEIWQRRSSNEVKKLNRFYTDHLAKRIKKMERKALGLVDILVPISEKDEQGLTNLGFKGLSMVVPTGYNFDEIEGDREVTVEFLSIFHLGGLDWHPNREGILWFLDNCWSLVRSELPDVRFYVAGRGAPDDFVQKIGSYEGVVYCGEVEDAREFMRTKALMIVPLLTGSGMRIKIVEGMALGKAVVSTNIGAEGIEADPETQIAIADEPISFAYQIINLLKDRGKLDEMGRNAKLFARIKLDNNRITKALLDFYSEML